VIRHVAEANLDLIGRGTMTASPDVLLLSARVGQLIDGFRKQYDYVLIDSPPLLAVADAALLGRHADAVLLVARAGKTRIDELRETVKRLEYGGVKASGVVLNGLVARSSRYGYGNGQGGYRYTDYEYGRPRKTGRLRALMDLGVAWRKRGAK
jgi:tyrosine-protein kinase Etk/Wzc